MTTDAQKRANAKWNKANRKIVTCSFSNEEYDAFKAYAEQNGKTVPGMLMAYARSCITVERRPIRRRGFTLDGRQYATMEALQAYLSSIGVSVTDNVILNWISKGRLSRANQAQYPILERIGTYEYIEQAVTMPNSNENL